MNVPSPFREFRALKRGLAERQALGEVTPDSESAFQLRNALSENIRRRVRNLAIWLLAAISGGGGAIGIVHYQNTKERTAVAEHHALTTTGLARRILSKAGFQDQFRITTNKGGEKIDIVRFPFVYRTIERDARTPFKKELLGFYSEHKFETFYRHGSAQERTGIVPADKFVIDHLENDLWLGKMDANLKKHYEELHAWHQRYKIPYFCGPNHSIYVPADYQERQDAAAPPFLWLAIEDARRHQGKVRDFDPRISELWQSLRDYLMKKIPVTAMNVKAAAEEFLNEIYLQGKKPSAEEMQILLVQYQYAIALVLGHDPAFPETLKAAAHALSMNPHRHF